MERDRAGSEFRVYAALNREPEGKSRNSNDTRPICRAPLQVNGERTMVSRLSVKMLLKSVIAIMGAAVITALLLSAWDSLSRLQTTNQIAAAAENTKYLFTAMHNLRTDRATTFRELTSDR